MKTLLIPTSFKPKGGGSVRVFWGKMGQSCGRKEQVRQEGVESLLLGGVGEGGMRGGSEFDLCIVKPISRRYIHPNEHKLPLSDSAAWDSRSPLLLVF